MTEPLFSIIKGEPSPEDVAALTALLSAMNASNGVSEAPSDIHAWNSKERMFRHFPIPGPGAWRASGLAQ
ncbi:MAG: acyl-CoA carboxylase subunit epsilon [Candidatus Nanopelagicales bacterium]|jgi:hypothetical protein